MQPLQLARHGTHDGYSNHGCRCEACTRARSAYMRERYTKPCRECGSPIYTHGRRSKRRLEARNGLCGACWRVANPPEIKHGSETGYRQGCRCDECRSAAATARKRRRRTPNVSRHGWIGYSNGCRCEVCRSGSTAYRWLIGPARKRGERAARAW